MTARAVLHHILLLWWLLPLLREKALRVSLIGRGRVGLAAHDFESGI